jgi:hypothetical protein
MVLRRVEALGRYVKISLEPIMDERTRRELFSAIAMQGILSRQGPLPSPADAAASARAYADALIAELVREEIAGGQ